MVTPREIVREAWRNTLTGVARPIIFLLVFVAVIGGLAAVHASSVVQINRDAEHWRAIGASTQIVQLAGGIDGARCDSLAHVPGVASAGAAREGQPVQLAALPSTTFTTIEGTPGLANVINAKKLSGAAQTGTWVSLDLAETLGIAGTAAGSLDTRNGTVLPVVRQYSYPEDGRLPILVNNVISEVPATGTFDSCWVEIWPEDGELSALLAFPLSVNGVIAADNNPKIQQLNSSEGTQFNGSARLEGIPSWLFLGAGALSGVAIGVALTWLRRLELASNLHAGISKVSLALQILTESVLSGTPAGLLSLTALLLVVSIDNPGSVWPAYVAGAGVIIVGGVLTLCGAVASSLLVSETRLFRYFKTR